MLLARRLSKTCDRQFGRTGFAETTMKLISKLALGAAAVVVATAASFPGELGDLYRGIHPSDMRKREALDACAAQNATFMRFLASDRENCYRQMRGLGAAANNAGVWSKPDHDHPEFEQN
jgi:hypothetical protein